MPVESAPPGNQAILDLLHRARQEPVIVCDEAEGEFAVLPLDDDVIDLLLERNPRLIEECRQIQARMDQGEYLTHEQLLGSLQVEPPTQ